MTFEKVSLSHEMENTRLLMAARRPRLRRIASAGLVDVTKDKQVDRWVSNVTSKKSTIFLSVSAVTHRLHCLKA